MSFAWREITWLSWEISRPITTPSQWMPLRSSQNLTKACLASTIKPCIGIQSTQAITLLKVSLQMARIDQDLEADTFTSMTTNQSYKQDIKAFKDHKRQMTQTTKWEITLKSRLKKMTLQARKPRKSIEIEFKHQITTRLSARQRKAFTKHCNWIKRETGTQIMRRAAL